MNGKMIGRKPLYVAVAQRKEDRKARLQVIFSETFSIYFEICGKSIQSVKLSVSSFSRNGCGLIYLTKFK